MKSICVNGKIMAAGAPALMVSNRGYRYGDGLFETMKVINSTVLLLSLHFDRFFNGLSLLKFEIPPLFTPEKLQQQILQLCKKNECEKLGRVRLSVFRGNGGLYDEDKTPQYVIECWPLNESVNKLNENGLVIDIYPDAKKSCDIFSNLKSTNFLPYTMAARYAKENKLNDCLVLNTADRIADSTIANLFIIKDDRIITPELQEGCVNGVMRRYLIEQMRAMNYEIREEALTASNLELADEVFLTNAINGIRWVKQCQNATYTNEKTVDIYNRIIKTISA
jgi:branched-chain amino acid aminotransferase